MNRSIFQVWTTKNITYKKNNHIFYKHNLDKTINTIIGVSLSCVTIRYKQENIWLSINQQKINEKFLENFIFKKYDFLNMKIMKYFIYI